MELSKDHRNTISIILQALVFFTLYYIYFGRFFIAGDSVAQGDSFATISLNNLAEWSMIKYHEFLWWDPTTFNGYPAYINLTAGWFNYLTPFSLPGHLISFILVSLFDFSVAQAVQIQFTVVVYSLLIVLVILLSRQLINSKIGRLIPPLIFTLGASTDQIHRLIQHGPALIPTLFYFYGLIYFFRNRTINGLYVFLASVIALGASVNYIIMSSAFFPLVTFTVIFLLLNKAFVKQAYNIFKKSLSSRLGKGIILLSLLCFGLVILNIYTPLHHLEKEVIRVLRDVFNPPVNYNITSLAGLATADWGGAYQKIFISLSQWAPFDDIYNFAMAATSDWPNQNLFNAKVDMRYIGIFTLPLILVAFLFPTRIKLLVPLFLTYFICDFVLCYSQHFPIFRYLVELVPVMKNTRCMANVIARDAPTVFAALIAGMGFDVILLSSRRFTTHRLIRMLGLVFLLFSLFILSFISLGAFFIPALSPIKESLAHIFIYLIFTLVILLGIVLSRKKEHRTLLGIALIIVAFADLSISSNYYWRRTESLFGVNPLTRLPQAENFGALLTNPKFSLCQPTIDQGTLEITQKCKTYILPDKNTVTIDSQNTVWVHTANEQITKSWDQYAKENGLNPLPVIKDSQNWYGDYAGHVHGFGKQPVFGLRSWLTLYTRPDWSKILETTGPDLGGKQSDYPYFRYYSSATFVSFYAINIIDHVKTPQQLGTTFYIHDKEALNGLTEKPKELDVSTSLLSFTPNRVKVTVDMPEQGFMYYLDSYDPYWRASVNDASAKVYKANFHFKAIRLPAGKSIVEWVYDPYPIRYGWIAFYVVFIPLITLMMYSCAWHKRRQ